MTIHRTRNLVQALMATRPTHETNSPHLYGSEKVLAPPNTNNGSDPNKSSILVAGDFLKNFDNLSEAAIEQMRAHTIQLVNNSMDSLEIIHHINVGNVRDTIDGLMEDVLSNNEVLRHLMDIRCVDDYTFSHSINVCILSLMTATSLGYTLPQLAELAIGSLLHDVGKVTVGQHILKKRTSLNPYEVAIVRAHPRMGYDILQKSGGIPRYSANVSLQHHERWDGKGYPDRLSGYAIHEYAQITSVADVYDALLANRPYRTAYSSEYAVDILISISGSVFEPRVLSALVDNIIPSL